MAKPEPMERQLYLCNEVMQSNISPLIQSIIKINNDDDSKEKEYRDWVREPIKLYIDSFGGSCYDGFSLISVIQTSKTPVYTIVLGYAMSMALTIFMSGHKRFLGKYSTLMFHDVSLMNYSDKAEGLKHGIEEGIRLRKMGIDILLSRSKIQEETLNDYIKRKADWYIPAEEAIKLEMADGYYQ